MRKLMSVVALACGLSMGGCMNDSRSMNPTPATISIDPSARTAMTGETITFVARSRDTYGRDAKIKWTSTAGKITTEQDGRVARATFTEPGTYSVRAILTIDGREVESDLTEVQVRSVK